MVNGGAQLGGQGRLEEVGLGEDLPARLAEAREVVNRYSNLFLECSKTRATFTRLILNLFVLKKQARALLVTERMNFKACNKSLRIHATMFN